jgi:hypothetical protein
VIRKKRETAYPITPDGRYFVVKGRLWRLSNPHLSLAVRKTLTARLMTARRAVRDAVGNPELLAQARRRVDHAKRSLGERGPVWWNDQAPDYNRRYTSATEPLGSAGVQGQSAYPGRQRTQHRKSSATLHACAMQPRGVKGGSASKISLAEPIHPSLKTCAANRLFILCSVCRRTRSV